MKKLLLVLLLCMPVAIYAHGTGSSGHGGHGGSHGGGGHGGSGHGGKGSHGHSPTPGSASHGPSSSSVVSSGNVGVKHGKVIRHPIRDGYKRKVRVAK